MYFMCKFSVNFFFFIAKSPRMLLTLYCVRIYACNLNKIHRMFRFMDCATAFVKSRKLSG